MRPLTVRLDRPALQRLAILLGCCNGLFIGGMMVFLHFWDRREHFGPRGRAFIDHLLVQFHLGVENVVAAWYSSMLLLLVAAACGVAFALDRRRQVAGPNGPSHLVDYAWIVFGCGFAALSLDEIGSFHERIGMMTSLNRASWLPHQATPVGWVVLFAVPIAAFAMGMLAFGWLRLRHAPWALALFAVGVGLYLCDPLLEVFEGAVKDRGGALLLLERVLEEGVAELGGSCCILFGVLAYCHHVVGGRHTAFDPPSPGLVLVATAALTMAIPVAHAAVLGLPAADTGIPENWFPAATLFMLAILLAAGGRAGAGAIALAMSAFLGAGLYGYAGLADARLLVTMLVTIAAGILMARYAALSARRRAPSTEHRTLTIP